MASMNIYGSIEDGCGLSFYKTNDGTTAQIGVDSSPQQDDPAGEFHIFLFFNAGDVPSIYQIVGIKLHFYILAMDDAAQDMDIDIYVTDGGDRFYQVADYGVAMDVGELVGHWDNDYSVGAKHVDFDLGAMTQGFEQIELDAVWNYDVTSSAYIVIGTQENATEAYRPYLEITYKFTVNQWLTLKWSLYAQILKTITAKWTVFSGVVKSLTAKWNIKAVVLKQLILKWSLYCHVTQSLTAIWNLLAPVTKTLTAKWNVLTDVFKTITLKWNLKGRLAKSIKLLWNVLGPLGLWIPRISIEDGQVWITKTQNLSPDGTPRTKPSVGGTARTKPETGGVGRSEPAMGSYTVRSKPTVGGTARVKPGTGGIGRVKPASSGTPRVEPTPESWTPRVEPAIGTQTPRSEPSNEPWTERTTDE